MAFGYDENGEKVEAIRPVSNNSSGYEKETVEDVLEYPIVKIPERGLSVETCKHFGIRCKVNELDEIEAIYLPAHKERGEVGSGDFYISGYTKKDLTVPKKAPKGKPNYHFTAVGDVSWECLLFGLAQAKKLSGLRVVITEGGCDSAAYWEACARFHMKKGELDKVKDLAIFSISLGTASAVKQISNKNNEYYLSKFDKRILCFDNDECTAEELKKNMKKGKEATKAVMVMYPDYKTANTRYELNDPNDMLLAGRGEELFWAMVKPNDYQSEAFIEISEYKDQIVLMPRIEHEWPWEGMNRITIGRRRKEVHFFTAGVKQGKSEIVNKIVNHIMYEDSVGPPTIFKFEEPAAMSIRKLLGYKTGYKFHDPSKVIYDGSVDCFGDPLPSDLTGYFTEDMLVAAYDAFDHDSVVVYNNEGDPCWETMKGDIRHSRFVNNSRDFFIDPLTAFSENIEPSLANTLLGEICRDMYSMALDMDINFYVFCHLNAPKFGPSHEEGGKIHTYQITGSKAMMRTGHGIWGLERNRSDDLPGIIRNMSDLRLVDERVLGLSGRFKLYYDKLTGSFEEPSKEILEEYEEALAMENEGNYTDHTKRSKGVEAGPLGFTNEDWVKEETE